MLNGDLRLRVYNRAKYSVGVKTLNGIQYNITPGSFQILTVNDILYIESAFKSKFFTRKILVPVDESGKDIDMAELGYGNMADIQEVHYNDNQIADMLKQSVKKIEAWIETINDAAELHAIFEVAKDMDLPASKLKVLNSHIKNKDWLGEMDEDGDREV